MNLEMISEICASPLKVYSAYNGKVLCHSYNKDKHKHLNEREVQKLWSDIVVSKGGYSPYATAVLCVYVDGTQEYEEECRKKELANK